MKIPFKAIAVLIILSLIGVFAYQAYWLTGLYSSMKKDMDNCLAETLQVSDYNEMMARCDSLKRNSNIDKYIKSSFEVDSIMTLMESISLTESDWKSMNLCQALSIKTGHWSCSPSIFNAAYTASLICLPKSTYPLSTAFSIAHSLCGESSSCPTV